MDDQPRRIDVCGFFHRLVDLDDVAPVFGKQRRFREQKVLPGTRRRVDAWGEQISDPTNSQDIAGERVTAAVPGEYERTARELALRFDDAMQLRCLQSKLGLQNPIGPIDAGIVDFRGASQANRHRGQILSGSGGIAQAIFDDPLALDARRNAGADAGSVRAHGGRLVVTPTERQQRKRGTSWSCVP